MKKIISLFLTVILVCSFALTVVGANREARQPDVFVNEVLVEFADQSAYITDDGRTLVPARGVFEALDCTVDWDADNYVVTVSRPSQKKEIVLKIDNVEMKVITDGKETVKSLEVPAQLMNNRTMIPLRAVSEALGCAIIWNEGEYSIRITEMKQISAEEFNEKLQMIFNASQNKDKEEETDSQQYNSAEHKITLLADKTSVKPGDLVRVSLVMDNNQNVCSMGYKLEIPKDAFEVDFEKNRDYFEQNGIEIYGCVDTEWYDEYLSLKSSEKWGDPVIGSDDNVLIFAVASANGISEKNSKDNFVVGKYIIKVSESAQSGEYSIVLSDGTTADEGKFYGAQIVCEPLKIQVSE